MSAHVLLNLFIELGKRDKCEASRAFYPFFSTSLINSIIQDHECQILFIIWHNVSRKSINHYYYIKSRVARYQRPCFNWQKPNSINQAFHVLLMHGFCTLHIRILGRHKN